MKNEIRPLDLPGCKMEIRLPGVGVGLSLQLTGMSARDRMIGARSLSSHSLEILSLQRVREFSILIPDSLNSKESALPFPRSIL